MKKTLIFCIVVLWLFGVTNTDKSEAGNHADIPADIPQTTEQCGWEQASWQAYCNEWDVDYLHPTENDLEQYKALKHLYQ